MHFKISRDILNRYGADKSLREAIERGEPGTEGLDLNELFGDEEEEEKALLEQQEAFVKFARETKGKDTEQRKAMAERVRAQNANSARGSGGQSQRAKARASARQRLKGK